MKNIAVKSIIVLSAICLIVALLLSSINLITAPMIEAAEEKAANEAFLEVLRDRQKRPALNSAQNRGSESCRPDQKETTIFERRLSFLFGLFSFLFSFFSLL